MIRSATVCLIGVSHFGSSNLLGCTPPKMIWAMGVGIINRIKSEHKMAKTYFGRSHSR